MSFKYSFLAVLLLLGCGINAIVLPISVLAQTPEVVSNEGETLLRAARTEIKNRHYTKAIDLFKNAMVIFETNGDVKNQAIALKELGISHSILKIHRQAIEYYQRSLELARKVGDRDTEGESLNNLGNSYKNLGKRTEAIEYYQQSLKIAQQINDRHLEIVNLNNLGNVYMALGKYPKAVENYQKSLITTRKIGNRYLEGANLNDLGNAYKELEKYPEAIEHYQQSLIITRQIGNRDGERANLDSLGSVYTKLGKDSEASAYYRESSKIARQIDINSSQAGKFTNPNMAYKHPETIDYLQQSLKISRQIGDRSCEGENLTRLGNIFNRLEKYPEAIDYYQQSLKIALQINDRYLEGVNLGNLGKIQLKLGKYLEAIDYFQKSLKIARKIGNLYLERYNISFFHKIFEHLGNYPEALNYRQQAQKISRQLNSYNYNREATSLISAGLPFPTIIDNLGIDDRRYLINFTNYSYYQQNLEFARQNGDRSSESYNLIVLGIIFQRAGKYSEAIDYYQQALKLSQQIGTLPTKREILSRLGNVYKISEKYSEAIDYYQQALKIARQIGMRHGEGENLVNLGDVYKALGKYSEAIGYYQQATNINDSLRTDLKDEDKVSLFQTQINSYKQLSSVLLLNQDLPGSLIAIERGRARAFSDLLSQRIEANPAITKPNALDFTQMQEQARSRQATIVSYSFLPVDEEPGNYKVIVHIISSIGKLTVRELRSPKSINLNELVDNNRTELLASRSSNKLTIDRLKPKMLVRLNGNEPDTRWQIVSVDPQKQTIVLQGIGQNARETEEVAFSDIAGIALPTDRPELRKLHQLLIEPIADLLPSNPLAPIIFIPDNALYEVPFAALQDKRGKYLIDLHTISIAPSISVLAQTAQIKQRNNNPVRAASALPNRIALVVGNPSFDRRYTQLVYSKEEAEEIAKLVPSKLLLGRAATGVTVKQLLPQARIAHFATHGILDRERGLNSRIVFAASNGDDGAISASQVLDFKLQADLVVLSACDTGRGKITGDGVIGLSRSFMAAGASSTIVSLWAVNDRSTAMLMTEFYRQWLGGKPKAQALRQAMLNTKAKYPDPYYWASMSLYGEND
jgi:CHAT domain-containing protein/tetratricopeptide (TPR) repeat protein